LVRALKREGFENAQLGGIPALLEGANDDWFDEQEDVFFAGVVGSDEGAAGGVEGALEEGSEDGRGDVEPVVIFGDFVEDAEVGEVELDDGGRVEQAAVEVADAVRAEDSVLFAHGLESSLSLRRNLRGRKRSSLCTMLERRGRGAGRWNRRRSRRGGA